MIFIISAGISGLIIGIVAGYYIPRRSNEIWFDEDEINTINIFQTDNSDFHDKIIKKKNQNNLDINLKKR